MTNPDSYGWGSGWPHCQTDKLLTVQLSSGLRLPVRRELAQIFMWCCAATENVAHYDIKTGETWTFACRPVRGYNDVPSFHSWAMAIDINAPENPMRYGSPGWQWLHDHGRTDMPSSVPNIWKSHMFEWGGDYPHRQDAMHMGFRGTPADAARITAALGGPTAPLGLTHALRPGDRGPMVSHVQSLLHRYAMRSHQPDCEPGPNDGRYGNRTALAVYHFKLHIYALEMALKLHLTFRPPHDGITGAVTLGALEYWSVQ